MTKKTIGEIAKWLGMAVLLAICAFLSYQAWLRGYWHND
jgi:hypothetical protein